MGLRDSGRTCFTTSPVAPLPLRAERSLVVAEPPEAAQPSTDLLNQ